MTTTDIASQRRALIADRSAAYEERAAEFSRRQAVLDVAGEAGRNEAHLDADEIELVNKHSREILRLDTHIDALTRRVEAAHLVERASALVAQADALDALT